MITRGKYITERIHCQCYTNTRTHAKAAEPGPFSHKYSCTNILRQLYLTRRLSEWCETWLKRQRIGQLSARWNNVIWKTAGENKSRNGASRRFCLQYALHTYVCTRMRASLWFHTCCKTTRDTTATGLEWFTWKWSVWNIFRLPIGFGGETRY